MSSKTTVLFYEELLKKKRRILAQAKQKNSSKNFTDNLQSEIEALEQSYQSQLHQYQELIKSGKRPKGVPAFMYYPNPLADESISKLEEAECIICDKTKKFFYMGPVYGETMVEEGEICPTCIANGKAHEKLNCSFNDVRSVETEVPQRVIDEILYRTPGFVTWQGNEWLFHCQDACQFLGVVNAAEVDTHYPDAKPVILKAIAKFWSDSALELNYKQLDRNTNPSAYLFQCRHCQEYFCTADRT